MKKTTYLPPSRRRRKRSALLRLLAALLIFGAALISIDRRIYPLIRDFAEAEAAIRAFCAHAEADAETTVQAMADAVIACYPVGTV